MVLIHAGVELFLVLHLCLMSNWIVTVLNTQFNIRKLSPMKQKSFKFQNSKKILWSSSAGANFVTFTCEPSYLLPYLMKRFESANGKVLEKRVNSFDELVQDYDLIINCTGLGAKILANDQKMRPIRGQVARVQASWIFQSTQNDNNYIIPKYVLSTT